MYFSVCVPVGALSQYNNQSTTRREVFHLPTEVSTRTDVSHTMLNDPYFSGITPSSVCQKNEGEFLSLLLKTPAPSPVFPTEGMMMTTQHTETSGVLTRQVTKEVVQRSVMGGTTVTKKLFYDS